MSQYTPLDNDGDCVEFDVENVEKMEVEFEECPACGGNGAVTNGIWWYTCPKCRGCEVVPIKKEG